MVNQNLNKLPDQAYFDAVYLHLPFCSQICPFCSFPVAKANSQAKLDYLDLLLKEIQYWQEKFGKTVFSKCTSLYIGGGTPSLYTAAQIKTLLDHLNLPVGQFFSFELNPEDCTTEYLLSLVDIGVNRISLGIQSFFDKNLTKLKRSHTAAQNYAALKCLLSSGIKNFNLDIMYGYPNQSLGDLVADIDIFLQFNPPHISAYGITLERNTPIYKNRIWQKWQLDEEKLFIDQFYMLNEKLSSHNLNRYEISNFAKSGYESPQNLVYWQGKSFLGIGLGSFSRLTEYRFSNAAKMNDWKGYLMSNQLPIVELDIMDKKNKIDEYLLIGLRLKGGVQFSMLSKLWPDFDWPQFFTVNFNYLMDLGYLIINQTSITLTVKGLMIADKITLKISSLIEKMYNPND